MNLFQKKHDWVLGGFEFLRADTTVETDPGSGGSLFAVDANGSTLHPYAKMEFGASGTQTPVSTGNPLPVVQTGTPGLPTGAATAAKQDTGNTSLATLAGAVAGTEVQVDIVASAAIPVTDNGGTLSVDDGGGALTVDGTVTANAGTGTFAISAAALPLPSGASTAAKQPALGTAGTASADVISVQGIASMTPLLVNGSGVTQPVSDAGGSLTTDTPQLPAALDGSGNLKVAIMAGGGSGGTAMADDAAFTPATTSITPVGGTYRSTLDAVDDGDAGAFAMTANRAVHVNLRDASGNELTAGAQYAEDAVHASGDFVTMAGVVRKDTATQLAGTDGDNSVLVNDASGRLHVNVGVLPASTNTIEVVGDAAHDAAIAGNPVRMAGRAGNADYTAVANGDTADILTDLNGKQIVLPYAVPENFVSGAITSAMTGTTSTSLIAAPAAGLRNYITTLIVSNAHATVGTDVVIQDGNGGTTLMTIPAGAVYGGSVISLPVPLRQPTTATAIYCANVTTGASTKVSAVGYKAP